MSFCVAAQHILSPCALCLHAACSASEASSSQVPEEELSRIPEPAASVPVELMATVQPQNRTFTSFIQRCWYAGVGITHYVFLFLIFKYQKTKDITPTPTLGAYEVIRRMESA